MKFRRITGRDSDRILSMLRQSSMSVEKIAQAFDLEPHTIRAMARANGISLKGRAE